jgi:hypothetical protein
VPPLGCHINHIGHFLTRLYLSSLMRGRQGAYREHTGSSSPAPPPRQLEPPPPLRPPETTFAPPRNWAPFPCRSLGLRVPSSCTEAGICNRCLGCCLMAPTVALLPRSGQQHCKQQQQHTMTCSCLSHNALGLRESVNCRLPSSSCTGAQRDRTARIGHRSDRAEPGLRPLAVPLPRVPRLGLQFNGLSCGPPRSLSLLNPAH